MERETVVRVPENVKEQTLQDIKDFMKDRPYRVETYKQRYGWNSLISVTKHE